MASALLNEYKFIRKIAENNGFINFTTDISSGSNQGDNYSSTITRVTIKENDRQLNLIVKSAKFEDEDPTNWALESFNRETYVYETVLPSFTAHLPEDKLFHEYPKYYGTFNHNQMKSLVFDDMKFRNYILLDRQKMMDVEHLTEVLKIYGKFHANSYKFKVDDPNAFEKIKDELGTPHLGYLFLEHSGIYQSILNAVENDQILYDRLKEREKYLENYFNCIGDAEDKYDVILHGDNWCNNILFKYQDCEDTKKITDVCLLDWQLAAVGSPICDLSYFLYVNGSKEQLSSFDDFLKAYHKSFHETLNNLDEVFSLDEIREEWKKHSFSGLIATALILPVMLVDSSDAPGIDEKDVRLTVDMMLNTNLNQSDYHRRMKDIVKFMYDHDFL